MHLRYKMVIGTVLTLFFCLGLINIPMYSGELIALAQTYKVTDMAFFQGESDDEAPPIDLRQYTFEFDRNQTTSIYVEYSVSRGDKSVSGTTNYKIVWYDTNDDVIIQSEDKLDWNVGDQYYTFWDGLVIQTGKKFTPGKYKVELYLDGIKTYTDYFYVFVPFATLSPKLDYIKLFESGEPVTTEDKRVYVDKFNPATTRYLDWEVSFSHTAPDAKITIPIYAAIYKVDNTFVWGDYYPTDIDAGWTGFYTYGGYGSNFPGKTTLVPGVYKWVLSVDGIVVANKVFTMVAPTPVTPKSVVKAPTKKTPVKKSSAKKPVKKIVKKKK
ncbi:MAG: hypothetical protein ACM3UZ_08515 [Acidobacteriota bacterium]